MLRHAFLVTTYLSTCTEPTLSLEEQTELQFFTYLTQCGFYTDILHPFLKETRPPNMNKHKSVMITATSDNH